MESRRLLIMISQDPMRPEVMGIAFAIVALPKDLIKRPIADIQHLIAMLRSQSA
ncbi:hypothetical protein [Ascidiaceihabitans sp.]|uniref:hypothetical protein n=1 Tax=Ascidiaceihabitans sp. TaxID=1872644 RepID=UPI003297FA5F